VWAHYGKPFVGNFDAASGVYFWQDPGYVTPGYLVGFGRSLEAPFYSVFHGLPDGFYSSLWGDGQLGGAGAWRDRPPWNYDLMAAGFLLALVPSLAIGVGLVAALVGLIRRPNAGWFLLLGLAGGLAVALLLQMLRYPNYSKKAGFLLSGLVPLCALSALGAASLARLGRAPEAILAVLGGTWAVTAYASLWVDSNGAVAQNWAGQHLAAAHRLDDAERCFLKAMAADPRAVAARLNEALVRTRRGDPAGAWRLTEAVLRDAPDDVDALLSRAVHLHAGGRAGDALEALRRAAERAPDRLTVFSTLGGVLMTQGLADDAVATYRQALRIWPSSPSDRANLGMLLARAGQTDAARAQYQRALALRPDHADWLADLAWLWATPDDAGRRDPEKALHLAEAACWLTGQGNAAALQALAAAQAVAGRFSGARSTARQASEVAERTRQTARVELLAEQIRCYEQGRLYHAPALHRDLPYPPVPPLGAAGRR
jgi:tetratricopeptide (TPR) repeat protein